MGQMGTYILAQSITPIGRIGLICPILAPIYTGVSFSIPWRTLETRRLKKDGIEWHWMASVRFAHWMTTNDKPKKLLLFAIQHSFKSAHAIKGWKPEWHCLPFFYQKNNLADLSARLHDNYTNNLEGL